MKERIIEALFEGWCEGDYELKKYEPDYKSVFNLICNYEEQRYIENAICGLVCEAERNAFINGVYLCLELLNGNIMRR